MRDTRRGRFLDGGGKPGAGTGVRPGAGEGRDGGPGQEDHRQLVSGEFWRRVPIYRNLPAAEFLDHRFQIRHSLTSSEGVAEAISELAPDDFVEDLQRGMSVSPMTVRITPYLLALIDWEHPRRDPIRLQFLPLASSVLPDHPMLAYDSLGEQADSPVPGLVHRYRDKALFLPVQTCPAYCRFCTRSYSVGGDTRTVSKARLSGSPREWTSVFDYIAAHQELEDILVSGGDAFNLGPALLRLVGERLLAVPHVRRLRFATKGIGVMPMRILSDPDWVEALTHVVEDGRRAGKQVAVHTHINSAQEITDVTREAAALLFARGVTIRNQSVLLRGVNDTPAAMALLIKRLGFLNIEPYYVYQHDLVVGVEDLRTPLSTILHLERETRGVTAGFHTPRFVVDAPGGGGKIPAQGYETYNRKTGISTYTSPYTRPGRLFLYFDPLFSLDEPTRAAWSIPEEREAMIRQAFAEAGSTG